MCDDTRELVESIVRRCEKPMVLDADALNCISQSPDTLKSAKAPVIITPHPAEMARLTGSTAAEVNSDREGTARSFSARFGVITVLKGAGTVIASPEGKILRVSGVKDTAKRLGKTSMLPSDIIDEIPNAFFECGII